MRINGMSMAVALTAIVSAPTMAEEMGSPDFGQIAQSGPSQQLVCRGGGDADFDFYANKNNTREVCVFFRWIRTPLRRSLPPPGHCGFVNRAPELKERRIRLFCKNITRTFQIRRWPPGSRQRYQFVSADAPYLANINNPRYHYRLLVSSQGTSFKVERFLGRQIKKRKKRRKQKRKTQ